MPGHETEKPNPATSNETTQEASYVSHKEHFTHVSPNSPLSRRTPENDSVDLSINSHTSTDQLYSNVCEMESSDQSPSRFSYVSYGQKSRIDYELRYLAGGGFPKEESNKNETIVEKEPDGYQKETVVTGDEKEVEEPDVTTRKSKKTKQSSSAKSSSSGQIPKPGPKSKKSGLKLNLKKNQNNSSEDPRYLGQYLKLTI